MLTNIKLIETEKRFIIIKFLTNNLKDCFSLPEKNIANGIVIKFKKLEERVWLQIMRVRI
jgi:hypothetical protein